jgi:two-component system, chemotaxis family, chemotaxis protein CheY
MRTKHNHGGTSMKCLVVDDDDFNRDYVMTLLSGVAECHEACSGEEAVAKFADSLQDNSPFDLILLDIMMPGLSGHESARQMRLIERTHGVPAGNSVKIIMLTALNSPQDAIESFYSVQSAAYVVKPVSSDKLFGIISKLGLLK